MKRLNKKRILIVNCYFDELRLGIRRKFKYPQSMTIAFLAGLFSRNHCDIKLYDEVYSGPLEDEQLLAFPDMLVLTGLNSTFDRMLHLTAYVRTKNPKAIVVAGGPAIRALFHYSKKFFDYCCVGDIEQLQEVIVEALGTAYASEMFLETGWVIPRFDLAYWMNFIHYIESSRNCYFRCSYCSLTAERARYQPYEIEYIRQQFLALGRQRQVHFLDNNFASSDQTILANRFALLKELWELRYFRRWGAEVTSDFFLREQNLEFAREAGCVALFCGVESFNKETLLSFRKYQNTNLPQEKMIRNCLEAGITFYYGIVLDTTRRTIDELKGELDYIIGNPEITLPSFITLAIPLLGTPLFYQCIEKSLFMPNVKLRDMDGLTITTKPMGGISETAQFVNEIQNLHPYREKIFRHVKDFYGRYRKILPRRIMALAQCNAMLLCAPVLSTAGLEVSRFFLSGLRNGTRTFIGSTESLDAVYRPAFKVESQYRHYFRPTMLTDAQGSLSETLHADLLYHN